MAAWIRACVYKLRRCVQPRPKAEPAYLSDLRRCILFCRTCRKAAARTGDWHREIFAEGQLRKARKLYRSEQAKQNARAASLPAGIDVAAKKRE